MKHMRVALPVAVLAVLALGAYVGHEDDRDMAVFLRAAPSVAGTALDDCAVCHTGGPVGEGQADASSCDYCHTLPDKGRGAPDATLNDYGRAFRDAGRDAAAVAAISADDSDGDGVANAEEIVAGSLPGDSRSAPDLPIAPAVTLTLEDLESRLPIVEQTVFLNVHKSSNGDSYLTWRGFKLWDVLELAGVADAASSLDVMAIDGFRRTIPLARAQRAYPQAAPTLGLGTADLGPCGWVHYAPAVDGSPLGDADLLLAFAVGGQPLEPSAINPDSGRLTGQGPFRLIVPQVAPSPPDISEFADPACFEGLAPEHRHHPEYDKNADPSVKAVVAIRVGPLPAGTRDVAWQERALDLARRGEFIVFGALDPAP